ncbi:MAG: type VI secretion system baseplate subunit TssK [Desulfovibrio sp.]|jgi:type VI secretion system protein ImpJ|nr:type VI secretion system baseplate subunit TssK [Desulfovibrio sp.]
MKGNRPVFWSQGLFLHPQHFQAADEATAGQIDLLRLYGLPYFWGVRRLVFTGSAPNHAVSVERLEAVFPSGAVVNVPFDAPLAPLALGSDWPAPDKPGTLYLGLALPKSGGANAAPESGEFAGTRFVYSEEPDAMPDMYGASAPSPVQRLKYAPILIRDMDLDRYADFERLPIAVLRRAGEHIELERQFLPPLLCLDASAHLSAMVREVRDAALSCAGRLAGYKTTLGADVPDMRFTLNFTALGILNRHIPALAHLQSAPNTHPWHIYGALRVFAGELSTFYDDVDCLGRASDNLAGVPEYIHDDPGACFGPLCGLLAKLLANLGIDESRTLHLLPDPPYFSADVPENFITPSCRYWLWVRADAMTETMAGELPRFVKLGARDRLNLIIAKAVSGVPLARTPSAPPGFLKRPDAAWYSVDTAHPLWQSIVGQGKVSLFWEGAPEGAEVRLVATGR